MKRMLVLLTTLLAVMSAFSPARSETTVCNNITALPAVIGTAGIYCLKQDLATSMATGAAITINANNVILDLNGFKLGGLGAGAGTMADGIYALNRLNITIRNGTVRGFNHNIRLSGLTVTSSSGHVVEDIRSESARYIGISVQGSNSTIRRSIVFGVGGDAAATAYGIVAQLGRGMTVIQNDVVGVSAATPFGIYAIGAPNAAIIENIVRDVGPADGTGISSDGLVRQNVIANQASGYQGVSGFVCVENVIRNFTNAAGCVYSNGNHTQ